MCKYKPNVTIEQEQGWQEEMWIFLNQQDTAEPHPTSLIHVDTLWKHPAGTP